MTIFYRTAGAWGPGIGANLSAAQVDGNFYDVVTRVRNLELNPGAPIQITSFNAIGNQLYIYMSDGTAHGPITLPTVRWRARGNWQPGVVYSVDDVFVGPDGATYLTIHAHTSGAVFSSAANDGQGNSFYSLLLQVPSTTLPPGGGGGTVLTKNSANNYDTSWRSVSAPPGGVADQMLRKASAQDGDVYWSDLRMDEMADVRIGFPFNDGDYLRWSQSAGQWVNQPRPIFNLISASSWAPVVGDEGSFMVLTNGTASTSVRIPSDDNQFFPTGSELHIHQDGTGEVSVDGEQGVVILKHASFSNKLLGQYATATVKKTWTNEWRLFGLLKGA